jgi:Spy/CpxP family protein refolding chaperone
MTTILRLTTVAGALLIGSLTLAPLQAAQGGPSPDGPRVRRMGPGGGPWGPMGDLARGLRALDLSDGQREQVRGIMDARRAEFTAIGERLRAAQRGLDALVTADVVDETAIRAKIADIAAVQADAAVLRARVHQEVFSILTAEQQAKARELRAQREQRLQDRAARSKERRGQRRPGQR